MAASGLFCVGRRQGGPHSLHTPTGETSSVCVPYGLESASVSTDRAAEVHGSRVWVLQKGDPNPGSAVL